MSLVVRADNLEVLRLVPDGAVDLVYIDPPFNTGTRQSRPPLRTVLDETGDRTGFGGRRYRTERAGPSPSFDDTFDDYLGFLEPRVREAHRVLAPTGCFYLHLDYREVHYAKVLADGIFGRDAFINEIVWAYDYGARTRRRWPAKHDDILFYAKDPARYHFDAEAVDRIPYMAPGLVGPEKAARGKLPTDTWWHTIVSPTARRSSATRRRSRWASCGASCGLRVRPEAWCSTSSPEAGPRAPPRASSGGGSCWWTRAWKRWPSCNGASPEWPMSRCST